jgi:hypothetical protein
MGGNGKKSSPLTAWRAKLLNPRSVVRMNSKAEDQAAEMARGAKGSRCYYGVTVDGVDYSYKCMIGVEFRDCNLRNVNLTGSDLSYARFIGCDLYQADFSQTVLYAAWFVHCDMTKAVFEKSFLSGIRISDCNVTHTVFGSTIDVGRVRKSHSVQYDKGVLVAGSGAGNGHGILQVEFGAPIVGAKVIEETYSGIYCEGFDRVIQFSDDAMHEQWRAWRRREEIAKILKVVYLDNGYYERGLKYYYLERQFRRRAMPWLSRKGLSRLVDFVTGEVLWAYGTSLLRPFLVYCAATIGAAVALLSMPSWTSTGGVLLGSCKASKCTPISLVHGGLNTISDVAYYLVTAAVGNNSYDAVGTGRIIFLAYNILALVLLSLWFASVARRLANI